MSQSCLGPTKKTMGGKFLTGLFHLTIFVVSKGYGFSLDFVFSHFSVICRGTHDTTNHFTMISALVDGISFLVFCGFFMALFFTSISCSIKVLRDVSLIALLIVGLIVNFYFILL